MGKHYIRSDNDGSVIISKKTLIPLGAVMLILGFIISLAVQAVALKGEITHTEAVAEQAYNDNNLYHPMIVDNNKQIAILSLQVAQQTEALKDQTAELKELNNYLRTR